SAEVAVIAHPSVPASDISRSQLLDIFTGDVKEWQNGEPVVIVDLKPRSDVKEAFYDYLGKSSSRMKSIWMRNMLTGEGTPPESLESQAEILERVKNTPGAIGYVNRDLVTGGVITLRIIQFGESK
ncbi:MAG: substrate-binding domain-containing protein, partial [Candidatus Krumholzibacteria bacterium]|nr:substrate-binding domain-containing protein [Candidatus Krumholzibacteria bacterium]